MTKRQKDALELRSQILNEIAMFVEEHPEEAERIERDYGVRVSPPKQDGRESDVSLSAAAACVSMRVSNRIRKDGVGPKSALRKIAEALARLDSQDLDEDLEEDPASLHPELGGTLCEHWKLDPDAVPFANVPLKGDKIVFLSPIAMYRSQSAQDPIVHDMLLTCGTFFKALRDAAAVGGGRWRIERLVKPVGEVSEAHIGYGRDHAAGRRFDYRLQQSLIEAVLEMSKCKSQAFDFVTMLIAMPEVGADMASDLTASVAKRHLLAFTKRCLIDLKRTGARITTKPAKLCAWHGGKVEWASEEWEIPLVADRPLMLLPKLAASDDASFPLHSCMAAARRCVSADKDNEGSNARLEDSGDDKAFLFRALCRYPRLHAEVRHILLHG